MGYGREVKCTVCPWSDHRRFGAGVLVDPCPECGAKVWFAELWIGDRKFGTDEILWPRPESYINEPELEVKGPELKIRSESKVKAPHGDARTKPILIDRSATGPVRDESEKLVPRSARSFKMPALVQRQKLSEAQKSEILGRQKFRCIYCGRKLGDTVWDSLGKPITLSTCFDHFEPFALRGNENPENFMAACKVCNTLKSDMVFESLKAARMWLVEQWALKGYQDIFPGMTQFRINLNLIDKGGWTGSGSPLQIPVLMRKPVSETSEIGSQQ